MYVRVPGVIRGGKWLIEDDSSVHDSSHLAPRELDRETAPSSCQESVSVLVLLFRWLQGDTDGTMR